MDLEETEILFKNELMGSYLSHRRETDELISGDEV